MCEQIIYSLKIDLYLFQSPRMVNSEVIRLAQRLKKDGTLAKSGALGCDYVFQAC